MSKYEKFLQGQKLILEGKNNFFIETGFALVTIKTFTIVSFLFFGWYFYCIYYFNDSNRYRNRYEFNLLNDVQGQSYFCYVLHFANQCYTIYTILVFPIHLQGTIYFGTRELLCRKLAVRRYSFKHKAFFCQLLSVFQVFLYTKTRRLSLHLNFKSKYQE